MKNVLMMIMLVFITTVVTSQECDYRKNEVDEFTGVEKKITSNALYIAYTDSTLLKYYKKNKHSYFELNINSGKFSDLRALYTNIRIDTDNAYKYYGSIRRDAECILKLSNGEMVNLKFADSNTGDTDYTGGYTLYSNYIILDDETYELLLANPVEKLRIYWSEGYQDYIVTNPNALVEQLKCIK